MRDRELKLLKYDLRQCRFIDGEVLKKNLNTRDSRVLLCTGCLILLRQLNVSVFFFVFYVFPRRRRGKT